MHCPYPTPQDAGKPWRYVVFCTFAAQHPNTRGNGWNSPIPSFEQQYPRCTRTHCLKIVSCDRKVC